MGFNPPLPSQDEVNDAASEVGSTAQDVGDNLAEGDVEGAVDALDGEEDGESPAEPPPSAPSAEEVLDTLTEGVASRTPVTVEVSGPSFPDTTVVPSPGGPIPVPYPNTAEGSLPAPATEATIVMPEGPRITVNNDLDDRPRIEQGDDAIEPPAAPSAPGAPPEPLPPPEPPVPTPVESVGELLTDAQQRDVESKERETQESEDHADTARELLDDAESRVREAEDALAEHVDGSPDLMGALGVATATNAASGMLAEADGQPTADEAEADAQAFGTGVQGALRTADSAAAEVSSVARSVGDRFPAPEEPPASFAEGQPAVPDDPVVVVDTGLPEEDYSDIGSEGGHPEDDGRKLADTAHDAVDAVTDFVDNIVDDVTDLVD